MYKHLYTFLKTLSQHFITVFVDGVLYPVSEIIINASYEYILYVFIPKILVLYLIYLEKCIFTLIV